MNESTTQMQIVETFPRGEFIALRINIKTERPKISNLYFYLKRLEKKYEPKESKLKNTYNKIWNINQ